VPQFTREGHFAANFVQNRAVPQRRRLRRKRLVRESHFSPWYETCFVVMDSGLVGQTDAGGLPHPD